MKHHCCHVLVSCLLLSCATALPPAPDLGEASQHLDGDQCIYFDVNGTDTICHRTGSVAHPFTLIKISGQACVAGHSGHAQDYITSLDPSSSLYDPTCNGQGCLPTAAPCDGTLDCCTGSCVNGTCANPGPAIGCHDAPGSSGNTGTDDLFYSGPIDTVNNVTFFRAPRDGTCSGDSFQAGIALITAASAAEAATKCQSITGGPALDASIWDGLAGFWLCQPSCSGGPDC